LEVNQKIDVSNNHCCENLKSYIFVNDAAQRTLMRKAKIHPPMMLRKQVTEIHIVDDLVVGTVTSIDLIGEMQKV
jgi:hypothetical protein